MASLVLYSRMAFPFHTSASVGTLANVQHIVWKRVTIKEYGATRLSEEELSMNVAELKIPLAGLGLIEN